MNLDLIERRPVLTIGQHYVPYFSNIKIRVMQSIVHSVFVNSLQLLIAGLGPGTDHVDTTLWQA